MHAVDSDFEMFTADQVRDAIRPLSRYALNSMLFAVEQATNLSSDGVWPLYQMTAVATVAKKRGLSTHMDGARLFNASVKSGVPVRDYCNLYDSVWIDLTKGLGSHAGSALAGSHAFIKDAWKLK